MLKKIILTTSLMFYIMIALNTQAAQIGVIIVSKAIIFSDELLSSPIGYITYGKKVHLGDKKRRQGTLLPIIISGRIAYIQTKDIALDTLNTGEASFLKTPRISEHDVEINFKTDQDKLSENNYVMGRASSYPLGTEWLSLSESFGDSATNATTMSVSMDHRTPFKKMSWGIGMTYLSISQSRVTAKTILVDGNIYYSLLHYKYLTFDIFGGLAFSADFKVTIDQGEQQDNGVVFGHTQGLMIRILPYSELGAFAGLALKTLTITDLNSLEDDNGQNIALKSTSGMELFAGLSYKF